VNDVRSVFFIGLTQAVPPARNLIGTHTPTNLKGKINLLLIFYWKYLKDQRICPAEVVCVKGRATRVAKFSAPISQPCERFGVVVAIAIYGARICYFSFFYFFYFHNLCTHRARWEHETVTELGLLNLNVV
jgi:hypothetical protein